MPRTKTPDAFATRRVIDTQRRAWRSFLLWITVAACASGTTNPKALRTDWPAIPAAAGKDPAVEARALAILRSMTLRQKVGQMTQAEIQSITPEQARDYYIGSVLNGGSSWPNGDKHAKLSDWLELSEKYYQASVHSDAVHPVPIIWGTDAVHGHSIVYGATLYPHNIGLGAAHDPQLVGEIGRAVARAVRASGIQWVFAPTLAVVRDDRWGRTYEGFAEDPALVEEYAKHYVAGLQGHLGDDDSVLATAKHFIGDGGTHRGIDRGETRASLRELIHVHGRGYFGALRSGVQTVMASFSSWNDVVARKNYGKMHGNRYLLTDVLKGRLNFDGFLVSDWNAIGDLPGCSDDSCPAAINAGIDMVMVPEDWRAFIDNTVRQVEQGDIPLQRIDDAVLRILRVKLRAGVFEQGPRANRNAGRIELLTPRALARRAVRESLVLLKNDRRGVDAAGSTPVEGERSGINGAVLPLRRTARVLVVGASADSFAHQAGGWSLTWPSRTHGPVTHAKSRSTPTRTATSRCSRLAMASAIRAPLSSDVWRNTAPPKRGPPPRPASCTSSLMIQLSSPRFCESSPTDRDRSYDSPAQQSSSRMMPHISRCLF